MPHEITSLTGSGQNSYDANQVQRVYNGLDQVTGEYQSHLYQVTTNNTPEVQYAYNEMANGQNNSRLVSMTYPNGYQLFYNYNTGLDNNISRLSSLSDSSGTLESYLYLGLDTVVERDHPQSGVNLSYIKQTGDTQYNSDGGDQYTGLDRFGRIIDQFWINASNGTTVDRDQYGYNQDGDVLYRQNLVDAAMSELYQYDNLQQLTSFARGTLNSGHTGIVGTPSRSQSWSPDALGNFTSVTTNGTAQTRTANQQNEYTSISGSGTLSYDADGNLTADGAGNTYVYDAWNRLVAVKNGSTTVASYVYDGLNLRIQTSESNSLTDSYYASSGQVLENYQGSTVTAYGVWSPVYVNALVYWARGSGAGATRYYALQDANWNVTAWVVSGTVVEREAYDPFGAVSVLSPSWGVQSSPLHIAVGFQGMGYDWFVSMDFADNRVYDPALMRWLQTDPLGQVTGDNGYVMEGNGPTDAVDPSGLQQVYVNRDGQLSPGSPTAEELRDDLGRISGKYPNRVIVFRMFSPRNKRLNTSVLRARLLKAYIQLETAYSMLANYTPEFLENRAFDAQLSLVKKKIRFYLSAMKKALDFIRDPNKTVYIDVWSFRGTNVQIRDLITRGKTCGYVMPWDRTGVFNLTPAFWDLTEDEQVNVIIHELFARSINDISSNDYEEKSV